MSMSLGAAALLMLTGTSPLSVVSIDEAGIHSVAVAVRDLDLSTPEGQKTLRRRVSTAVGWVCSEDGVPGLKAATRVQTCKAQARGRIGGDVARLIAKGRDRAPALAAAR